jgi:hypothetical protein
MQAPNTRHSTRNREDRLKVHIVLTPRGMNISALRFTIALGALVAQGCSFSNAPFFPTYAVELSVRDFRQVNEDPTIEGTFERGSIELINTVGSCTVQLKLGQCKAGEEIWVNFKALPNSATCQGRCPCEPSVWERLKAAQGHSIALTGNPELTRIGDGVFVEVLAGRMEDTDGNGVVDKRTDENRVATEPLTIGKVEVHKATESPGSSSWPPFGEFYADLEASDPIIGFVRGRIDAAVEATDGTPVGPRCHWEVEQLREDN